MRFSLVLGLIAGLFAATASGATVEFARYVGGTYIDQGRAVAIDEVNGFVYVAGIRASRGATSDAPDDYDAFLSQYDLTSGVENWSTTLAGSANEGAHGVAVDSAGNVWVVGSTVSDDLAIGGSLGQSAVSERCIDPVDEAFGQITEQPCTDAFAVKYDSAGSYIAGGYLGGGGADSAREVVVAADDSVYVLGTTSSYGVPPGGNEDAFAMTADAFQAEKQGDADSSDLFLLRLDVSGNALTLVYGTFFGGSGDDTGGGLAVQGNTTVYLAGDTSSADLVPTAYGGTVLKDYVSGSCLRDRSDPFSPAQPCRDAFVAKLTIGGTVTTLDAITYFGGEQNDYASGVGVDAAGDIYLAGSTLSPPPPDDVVVDWAGGELPPNQYFWLRNELTDSLEDSGTFEGYVAKFDATLGTVLQSTFIRGGDYDVINALAVVSGGEVYVAGHSWSRDLPLAEPFQASQVQGDIFLAKLNADGTLGQGTLLGGHRLDYAYGLAVDAAGNNAYLTGGTWSRDFPATVAGSQFNEDDESVGAATRGPNYINDAFLVKVSDVAATVDLRLDASVSAANIKANEELIYSIDVTNQSATATAGDVRLVMEIPFWAEPSGVSTLASLMDSGAWTGELAVGSCVRLDTIITCRIGDLAAGASANQSLGVTPVRGGNLLLRFGAMSLDADAAQGDNNASLTVAVEGLTRRSAADPLSLFLLAALAALWWRRPVRGMKLAP